MPITEYLKNNATHYPEKIALVELNPEIKEKRVTWKEFELIEPSPDYPYRRE